MTDTEQDSLLQTDGRRPTLAYSGEMGQGGGSRVPTLVPDVLLKSQTSLGLNATELVVLLNLTMHWWFPKQKPFPRSQTIAQRMGVDVRTVQRAMSSRLAQNLG